MIVLTIQIINAVMLKVSDTIIQSFRSPKDIFTHNMVISPIV